VHLTNAKGKEATLVNLDLVTFIEGDEGAKAWGRLHFANGDTRS
jgi:hypothetical protein